MRSKGANDGLFSAKETVVFRKVVPAAEKGSIKERIKADGRIVGVRVKFAKGQQETLHVRPYLQRKRNFEEELLTYAAGSDNYLAGDDVDFEFPISWAVSTDDEIKIDYHNTQSEYAYTLLVFVDIDYTAGQAIL